MIYNSRVRNERKGINGGFGRNQKETITHAELGIHAEKAVRTDPKGLRGRCSYAEALMKGKEGSMAVLSLKAFEVGNEWLYRSAVGRLISFRAAEDLVEEMIAVGMKGIYVREFAGKFMLLTFQMKEEMIKSLLDFKDQFRYWFEDVQQW